MTTHNHTHDRRKAVELPDLADDAIDDVVDAAREIRRIRDRAHGILAQPPADVPDDVREAALVAIFHIDDFVRTPRNAPDRFVGAARVEPEIPPELLSEEVLPDGGVPIIGDQPVSRQTQPCEAPSCDGDGRPRSFNGGESVVLCSRHARIFGGADS